MLVALAQAQICPVHGRTCEGHEPGDLWDQGDQDVRLGVCLQGACGRHSQVGAVRCCVENSGLCYGSMN